MGNPAQTLLALFVFLLASITVFPFGKTGSSIYYTSVSFFMAALFLSSYGKGFAKGLSYLRLNPRRKDLPGLFLWGIAALAVSISVTAAATVALYFLGYLDAGLVGEKIASLPALALVLAFTIAPVGEEALFRGYLFRKISDKSSSWILGALLSSAMFASLHLLYGSVAEIIVAFLIALVFCAFTQKTGSLIPAIIAHSTFNFLSIVSTVFL